MIKENKEWYAYCRQRPYTGNPPDNDDPTNRANLAASVEKYSSSESKIQDSPH